MTSTVKFTAHCANTKHVLVEVMHSDLVRDKLVETRYLEDGESTEFYIYDNRYVVARELEK